MDSGHEVVLVDVNLATTNGINGTHDEIPEMKTRSKVTAGEAAEPKTRLTRTTAAQNEKDGSSDPDKKDIKKKLRSGGADADEAIAGAKPVGADATGAKPTAGAIGAASKTPAPTAPTLTASKKKALERDDDSGINSRASSVSNDDVATPARMRTRSSRASEIASTSTPAPRRGGAARVPLSIYEYDAVSSFDDDLPLAATLAAKGGGAFPQKRKAVVYVEEMEDDEAPEAGAAEGAEPAPKRRAAFLVSAGAGIVTSLLYPWRKLRSGIAAMRPFKAPSAADAASAEQESRQKGADGAVAPDQSTDAGAPTNSETAAPSSDQPVSDEAADTCSLM